MTDRGAGVGFRLPAGPRNHSDPVYHEHFGISDVPPGEYVLGVEIGGKRVFRRVKVEVGKLSWIEFRP